MSITGSLPAFSMLKVGLTGGIGSGKTRVSGLFEELGVTVIDADQIAHELVAPHQPALIQIAQTFGEELLQADDSLDRAKLRQIAFNDPTKKLLLEAIMHPLVFEAIQNAIGQLDEEYCIVSIPLLFETGMNTLVNRVLVVDCPEAVQIERVMKRDKLPAELIQKIMASQAKRETRLAQADEIIDNSRDDSNYLLDQVEKLHNFYRSISASLR